MTSTSIIFIWDSPHHTREESSQGKLLSGVLLFFFFYQISQAQTHNRLGRIPVAQQQPAPFASQVAKKHLFPQGKMEKGGVILNHVYSFM